MNELCTLLLQLYPENIASFISEGAIDKEQVYYVLVFECDNEFHKKYYIPPNSGKFFKLERFNVENESFLPDIKTLEKVFKTAQEKFTTDFSNFNSLLTIVAQTNKDKLTELYKSQDLEEIIKNEKERLYNDLCFQNKRFIGFKEYFYENKPILEADMKKIDEKLCI